MTESSAILPAPVVNGPVSSTSKWQQEYQAFLRLLPELLEKHRGKYVAIHEGKLADLGDDKVSLALRVYASCGYVPIYVGLVAERPLSPARIPHYRVVSPS